jgi:adenylate cyclase
LGQIERKLVAIMFTDLVGFTSLGQKSEYLALDFLERYRHLLRQIFIKHGGKEIKTIGDGFLVEFSSAVEAALCAVDIQHTIHSYRIERGDPIRVKVGIHSGDVVHKENDMLGDAVNVASRIHSLVQEGGICISRNVYEHVRNVLNYPFEKLEGQILKNIAEPLDLYRIVLPFEVLPVGIEKQQKDRIAVLPFSNISMDEKDEFFSDGITDEIIGKLSEIKELRVVARTSVMTYKRSQRGYLR